jgi:Circularly permutated YpsA SLOG family
VALISAERPGIAFPRRAWERGVCVFDLRSMTIVSGGQTGADRAALDFAIAHGIAQGGWCPRGRLAEDGTIPSRYELRETPLQNYAQRTEWNVRDSDATVLFTLSALLQGGTALTRDVAERLGKPWLHLVGENADQSSIHDAADRLSAFLGEHVVRTLNVAGPRASQEPGVANFVGRVLATVCEAENAWNL